MRNLVPQFILRNLVDRNWRGTFPAAGMFVDISGFTQMTAALMKHGPHGAEVLAALMRAVFGPLIHSVYTQGGTIIGLAGDAFTAVFPLDVPGEDGCWRGLAAAWQIQGHIAAHPVHTTPYGDFSISAKVGLASGEVSWGIVTSSDERRGAYYFRGTTIDGCSECEHLAQPGEIIIDSHVYACIKELVTVEEASQHFRVREPVEALPPAQSLDLPDPPQELLERFFPAEVVRQSFSGEFRPVVSMFINLPTVRTEDQLDIFMQSLFQLQDRFSGMLSRLDFGDKGSHLLLFWGAPIAFENDIERALGFILELQEETSIPIKAGITYQLAHAGFVGSALREEYTCYGQGTNLAARFMTEAPRGAIWVDEHIARRAHDRFEIESLGSRSFKGFSQEQPVFLLLEPLEMGESIFQGELVGRGTELSLMAGFIEPLSRGEYAGGLVVWGEAGIGKSRLVHEFRNSTPVQSRNILWAECQADEILRESLNPFRFWLRDYFEVSTAQVETRNKRNFNRILDTLISSAIDGSLAAELDRTRSFLAALLNLSWPDSLYEQLDAEGRYENTLIALTTLFKVKSLQQPVLIHIEDAHWLDQDSRIFLQRLMRALALPEAQSFPIAILATARPEMRQPLLGEGVVYDQIELDKLSHEELTKLATTILQGPVAPNLMQQLSERAEGNPFFAEQIIGFLKEEGDLEQSETGWCFRQGLAEPLPVDVRAVLIARLDRLVQEVKTVVQTASVLGSEFEVRLLAGMLAGDERSPRHIEQADEAGIWTILDELRRLFRHNLLREAAYRMLVRSRRQALHALAVEAIETLYASDLSPHYAELAYHAENAGLESKARQYFHLAGRAAQENFHNEQAVEYFSRALERTPPEDFDARYRLFMAREQVYRPLGAQDQRSHDLDAIEKLIEASSGKLSPQELARKQAELEVRRAVFVGDTNDFPASIEAARSAVDLSMQVNAPQLAVEAYVILCHGLQRVGETQTAARQVEAGLKIAREHNLRSGEVLLLNSLGFIYMEQGNYALAHTTLEESLAQAREIKDRRTEAKPLLNLGTVAAGEGDFSSAREYYEQALKAIQEIGDRSNLGIALINLGWIAGVLGDYAKARQAGTQVMHLAGEMGDQFQQAYALLNLSAWSSAQADFSAGQDYAQRSLEMSRTIVDRSAEAWALTYLGHASAGLGDLAQANDSYQAALALRHSLEQAALACEPLAGLTRVALTSGDPSTARAYVKEILAHLDSGGTLDGADEPLRVYWTCIQVLRAANDPRAESLLDLAYTVLIERADKIKAETDRFSFLNSVAVHREILAAHASR